MNFDPIDYKLTDPKYTELFDKAKENYQAIDKAFTDIDHNVAAINVFTHKNLSEKGIADAQDAEVATALGPSPTSAHRFRQPRTEGNLRDLFPSESLQDKLHEWEWFRKTDPPDA